LKCNGVINKGGITYKNTPWHLNALSVLIATRC
jgi:hypothetical protein